MLTILYLDHTALSANLTDEFMARLTPPRRERAASLRRPEDISACVCGELLLHLALFRQTGLRPGPELDIRLSDCGKPYLPDFPQFHYNLSHSGRFAALAWGDRPLGLDVQQILPDRGFLRIADRFFTKAEQQYIREAAGNAAAAQRFTEIWTMKESYVKFLGSGLWTSLSSFSADPVKGLITPSLPSDPVSKSSASDKPLAAPRAQVPLIPAETFRHSLDADCLLCLCSRELPSRIRMEQITPDLLCRL